MRSDGYSSSNNITSMRDAVRHNGSSGITTGDNRSGCRTCIWNEKESGRSSRES